MRRKWLAADDSHAMYNYLVLQTASKRRQPSDTFAFRLYFHSNSHAYVAGTKPNEKGQQLIANSQQPIFTLTVMPSPGFGHQTGVKV
jgi:hypothetical protein